MTETVYFFLGTVAGAALLLLLETLFVVFVITAVRRGKAAEKATVAPLPDPVENPPLKKPMRSMFGDMAQFKRKLPKGGSGTAPPSDTENN